MSTREHIALIWVAIGILAFGQIIMATPGCHVSAPKPYVAQPAQR